MKKTLTSVLFIGTFAVYAFFLQSSATSNLAVATNTDTQHVADVSLVSTDQTQVPDTAATKNAPSANSVTTQTQTSKTTKTPPATAVVPVVTTAVDKPKGQFADGTYTGSSENAFYGYVQVKATISGGKLTDVQFLSYPNDRRDSVQINRRAMPILKQQAISAQSAQVDGVSGASDTSEAFMQSLSNALQQAKA